MDLEQARAKYKELYGKAPGPKSKLETIVAKIQAATPPELPEKEPAFEPKLPEKAKAEAVVVSKGIPGEAKIGRGRHTLHRVIFRGNVRYWSHNTIVAMSKTPELKEQIEFPENTEYDGSQDFNKCKNCG